MKALQFAVAFFAGLVGITPAAAQTFPSKPIEIVIPFAPGGVSDLLIRAIAPKLQDEFKQPVIVLNKPGANGNTHTASAMQAPADGHTLIQTPLSTLSTNPFIYGDKLPYKANELSLIAPLASLPLFLVVHPSVPAKNLKEFVAWAKANPGSTYGSAGIGGSNHLAGEMLRYAAGVEITHVPFNGSAPALNAVLGGHVQWMFDSGRVLQHVKAGKLVLIAVATEKRMPDLPDVATLAETYPGFVASGWHGIAGPPNMSKALVEKINGAVNRALKDPEVVKTLTASALVPMYMTPEEYAVFVAAESKKFAEIIRKSNIKVE
ncbi:MAG: tripartite tricarboxylate transporter substrate binding protein [Usitatibacter sp.]